MAQNNNTNIWFPSINSISEARSTALYGFFMALIIIGFNTIFALVVSFASLPAPLDRIDAKLIWIDIVLFAAIAFDIGKMSRIAAIAGLLLYILGRFNFWSMSHIPGFPEILLTSYITSTFINSIRGTFAYHKFRKNCTE
jgi:hypothetical protein